MPRFLALLAILIAAPSAQSQPRAAYVYSSFRDGQYWYRDEMKPVLDSLGWRSDGYENTQVAELVRQIDRYQVVVCSSSFNYSSPQDLGRFGPEWRRWLAAGGCLVVTDANYGSHFGWLEAINPTLRWSCRGQLNRWAEGPPRWADIEHPLMRGVDPPRVAWTNPSTWSDLLTPLAMDTGRRPVVAYRAIGDGLVVVSSAYRQYGFPSAPFLRNLVAWARDPSRLAAVRAANQGPALGLPAPLSVVALKQPMVLDGSPSSREWHGATVLPTLLDPLGRVSPAERSVVRLARRGSDLTVAFDCEDGPAALSHQKGPGRDGDLWAEDDLELDLSTPSGTRYRFIVSADGHRYDDRNDGPEWDGYWQAVTRRGRSGWSAELRIPLDLLPDGLSTSGWRANVIRRRQSPVGGAATVTAWSPITTNSSDASRYGALTFAGAPSGRATPCDITVRPPDHWYVGRNTVEATVPVAGLDLATARLACMDDLTGQPIAQSPLRPLGPGGVVRVRQSVNLWSGAGRRLQFVLFAGSGSGRAIGAGPVVVATPAPVLEAALVYPGYRGMVQSRDTSKRLHIRATVGVAQVEGLRLEANLAPARGRKATWRATRAVRGASVVDIGTSLAALPVGRYTVRVSVTAVGGRTLASKSWPVRVMPSAPFEVTFDDRRICRLNGKPFFPIGIMHISEPVVDLVNKRALEMGLPTISVAGLLQDVKDHGFNCVVRGWGMPGEEYLGKTDELGLWVMPEVGAPSGPELAKLVARANRHRSVLLWYGVDEPSGDKLESAIAAHSRFQAADPRRPVSAACNDPSFLTGANRAYDVVMMDLYIAGSGSYAAFGDWIRRADQVTGGAKAVWMIPQAFALDGPFREPTIEEVRCQAYASIVHGATGLVWYAYYTTEPYSKNPKGRNQWFIPDTPLWPFFTKLNAEISGLAPVFMEGKRTGRVRCTSDVVQSQSWSHGGRTRLVAVNVSGKPVRCTVSGLKGDSAQVLFEGRGVAITSGSVDDAFGPYEVHVYRY